MEPIRECDHLNSSWDINDTKLPVPQKCDSFDLWPRGYIKNVYSISCEEARRHVSGWAMRNTNNHNVQILKKSCLGVLLCSANCQLPSRDQEHQQLSLRPAICDKARRKQCGRSCPNPNCQGIIFLQPCRGHSGYPVTHLWKKVDNYIYFQAKGVHDHPMPDLKPIRDQKRRVAKRTMKDEIMSPYPFKQSKLDFETTPTIRKDNFKYGERLCSCPPFECLCTENLQPPMSSNVTPTFQSLSPNSTYLRVPPAYSSPMNPFPYLPALSTPSYLHQQDNTLLNRSSQRDSPLISPSHHIEAQLIHNHNHFQVSPSELTGLTTTRNSNLNPGNNSSWSSGSPLSPRGLLDLHPSTARYMPHNQREQQPLPQLYSSCVNYQRDSYATPTPYITSAFSLMAGYAAMSPQPQSNKIPMPEFLDQQRTPSFLPIFNKS